MGKRASGSGCASGSSVPPDKDNAFGAEEEEDLLSTMQEDDLTKVEELDGDTGGSAMCESILNLLPNCIICSRKLTKPKFS
jgi:hypothetical protein